MNTEASKRVKDIQEFHKCQRQIEKANGHYQSQANKHRKKALFQPKDLVWVHLRKERFPSKRKFMLMPCVDGPIEVLEKINDNAYKIELPRDYGVSCTFSVSDPKLYFEDDKLENLRGKSFLEGEDDVAMGDQQGEPKQGPKTQDFKSTS